MEESRKLIELIQNAGINGCHGIPFSSCIVKKQYLVDRLGFVPLSAYIFIIPYYSELCDSFVKRNVSIYASAKDYHLFIEETGKKILDEAKRLFPGRHFEIFGDRSPIDERDAAAKAGLGIIGDNGMLITEKYSSYVFLAEIITDIEPEREAGDVVPCDGCGKCRRSCPVGGDMSLCLSLITQKKGELTPAEQRLIASSGSAWGCDICQEVCPHTIEAKRNGTIYSPIPFFNTDVRPVVSAAALADETDFVTRAYSWRGHGPIERNLALISSKEEEK